MIQFKIASQNDVEALAHLRIEVFREFPYLYEGTLDYEKNYLKTYTKNAEARIFLALDDGQVVGASSCVPMKDETDEFKLPLVKAGHDINKILYFGESVLKKEYRGRGIGVQFFNLRENWAQELGLKMCVFCSVIRPTDHHLRPKEYQDLSDFWHKRGYEKLDLQCEFDWLDVGEKESSVKKMEYWGKKN